MHVFFLMNKDRLYYMITKGLSFYRTIFDIRDACITDLSMYVSKYNKKAYKT